MPCIKAGDVAPHDLREISGFLRNLNGADIDVSDHPEVITDLMAIAELNYNPDLVLQDTQDTQGDLPTEEASEEDNKETN